MVVTRHVKPGCEAQFESWLRDYASVAESQPGHLGFHVVRPAGSERTYTVVANFDSSAHLQQWLASAQHGEWIAKARPLLEADEERKVVTGLETWFTPPASTSIVPPPRWKMFLVTWMVVWGVVWILDIWYAPLIAPLPVWLRSLVFTVVIVGLLTFVLMPNVTKLLHGFLYPRE